MSLPGPERAPLEPSPVLAVGSLSKNGDLVRRAANVLRRGGLVAFPTECSYVLGCRADDPEALRRLAQVRGRSAGAPATLYFGDAGEAEPYLQDVSEMARRFVGLFWPGPLTLILRRSPEVPEAVCPGLGKVAVRVPGHRLAQAFLRQCRLPVAAASAHLPGSLPAVEAGEVLQGFGAHVEALLEWREPPLGLEATVLDATGRDPRVVRLGFVTPREIARVARRPVVLSSDVCTPSRFTRFSPEARLIVVEGEPDRVARRLKFLRETFAGPDSSALLVTPALAGAAFAGEPALEVLPDPSEPEALGERLFGLLKRLERQEGIQMILVAGLPREGPAAAVMERLCRVAHQVINTEDPGYAGQGGMQPRTRRK